MREIEICEVPLNLKNVRIVIIKWSNDYLNQDTEMVKRKLDDAVSKYVGNISYNEFISKQQDNPYIRVLIFGINILTFKEFNIE